MFVVGCQHEITTHAEARMGTVVVCAQPKAEARINDRKPGTRPGDLTEQA
jgi:hypothetical protein